MKKAEKTYFNKRKHLKKVVGSIEKPRLSLSHKHIYGQIIDDQTGHTLRLVQR